MSSRIVSVLLFEHDEVLLVAIRSFNSILYSCLGQNLLGIRVFLNLRLTVSEDLLLLSVQESPNLFTFRVVSQFRDFAKSAEVRMRTGERDVHKGQYSAKSRHRSEALGAVHIQVISNKCGFTLDDIFPFFGPVHTLSY